MYKFQYLKERKLIRNYKYKLKENVNNSGGEKNNCFTIRHFNINHKKIPRNFPFSLMYKSMHVVKQINKVYIIFL